MRRHAQLDHVRHAGAPVLSAPSPRHTDCRARAPLAGISPSSFSNLLLSLVVLLNRARAAQSPSSLALSLLLKILLHETDTWTQVWGLMDYFSRPFSLCHSIFISIIMAFIDESFIMMFIECVSMIMITIIVIAIMISMITTTAVLLCPPSVPVQPEREGGGGRERGRGAAHQAASQVQLRQDEREREGERAAAGQRGRSARAWRR